MGELVDIGTTRLYVEERGTGSPVLVLHGGPGADHTELLGPLTPLAEDFRMLFVDQRSQGRSDRTVRETWTIAHAARDVVDLAAALQLDHYGVLGHSYGALVALQHAVDFPGAAAASVVSHGVPSARWYRLGEELAKLEPEPVRCRVEAAWQALASASTSAETARLIAEQMPFHFRDPQDARISEVNKVILQEMVHTPDVTNHMSSSDFGGFDVEEQLGDIPQPVLVLTGRYERTCPAEAAHFVAERIPRAELVVFEESAHCSYVEEPDRYVSVVRGFLRPHLI